ncbi:MAG: hypothetical protein LC808_38465 [Actinobacteria bacterium]|nr:hypothetical protein [Actinomycetota bacterium]
MADEIERDVVLHHPNREHAGNKLTKYVIFMLLLVSVALVAVVTVGGWSKLEGAKPVQIGYMLVYLVMAFYVLRWNRGVLPLAAALAIILAIFAGISGPEWLARDKEGFTAPELDESVLALFTFLIVPVQVLLIAFAMRGFQQAWNVEEEVPNGDGHSGYQGHPQTA